MLDGVFPNYMDNFTGFGLFQSGEPMSHVDEISTYSTFLFIYGETEKDNLFFFLGYHFDLNKMFESNHTINTVQTIKNQIDKIKGIYL